MLCYWHYGDSFTVIFDAKHDTVYKVESTGKNGLKIPMGKAVGNNIIAVSNYYNGRCYFTSDGNGHTLRLQSGGVYMLIKATPDAEITEIRIYPRI
nr:MAG TPA: hypothetical protein [Caudoviricetes sp.]